MGVSEVPATPVQCEAAQGSLSFPCAFQDLLADGEGNDSAQIRARKGGPQEASDVRGHPASLRQKKRMVIPSALRVLRLKPGRKYCSLGRLSHEVGWKYQDVVETLEAKRRVKAEAYYKKASAVAKIRQQVRKDAKVVKRIAPYQKIIESYGYA